MRKGLFLFPVSVSSSPFCGHANVTNLRTFIVAFRKQSPHVCLFFDPLEPLLLVFTGFFRNKTRAKAGNPFLHAGRYNRARKKSLSDRIMCHSLGEPGESGGHHLEHISRLFVRRVCFRAYSCLAHVQESGNVNGVSNSICSIRGGS